MREQQTAEQELLARLIRRAAWSQGYESAAAAAGGVGIFPVECHRAARDTASCILRSALDTGVPGEQPLRVAYAQALRAGRKAGRWAWRNEVKQRETDRERTMLLVAQERAKRRAA